MWYVKGAQIQTKLQRKGFRVNEQKEYEAWLRYQPMWHKWAYQMGQSIDDISDWEQESYLVFRAARKSYQGAYGIGFSAYYRMLLYRYGKKCLYKPRAGLGQAADIGESEGESIQDEGVCVEQQVTASEAQRTLAVQLTQVLGALQPKEYEIIRAFYFEKQSLQHIAATQHMTYDAVESKKRRILKKMKKYWLETDGMAYEEAIYSV